MAGVKQRNPAIEDSNIAKLGSKEEKDARLNAAKTEEAWHVAGKEVGIQIWRIEKFHVVPWPKNQYGSFYDGDAYIVLQTYKKDPKAEKLSFNIFFWLGVNSSQDEQGTAAYKTVELDDYLGTTPVEYREVQGFESEEFVHLFGGHIKLLSGGVESGFHHVKPEDYQPRLLHLKGKKQIRVTQTKLNRSHLNDGDVFILDAGLQLWQWNGKQAGIFEKRKGEEIIEGLKSERNGRPKSTILDSTDDDEAFWKILGGKGAIPPATPDDENKPKHVKQLYRLSDSSGSLKIESVAQGDGNIKRSLLKSDDVFVLDVGVKLHVWVGKRASKQEKDKAITTATEFLKQHKRDIFKTAIVRIIEDGENEAFLSQFSG